MQHAGVKFDPFANVPPDIVEALLQGQKIKAIQLYRRETGTRLREAKNFIEELQQRAGLA
jgi:ribosomal protein L7/L12